MLDKTVYRKLKTRTIFEYEFYNYWKSIINNFFPLFVIREIVSILYMSVVNNIIRMKT